MARAGIVVVAGATYYSESLWEALVAQNIEMGRNQQAHYQRHDKVCAERNEAMRKLAAMQAELDFALDKLETTAAMASTMITRMRSEL